MFFFKWLWQKLRDESGQTTIRQQRTPGLPLSVLTALRNRAGGNPARNRGNFLNFEQFIPEQLGDSPFETEEALGPEFEQLLQDLQAQTTGITPEEQQGLGEIEEAADPAAQLAAFKEQTEAIFRPEAEAALTARGFGRSPAIAEVLGKESARGSGAILARAAQARQRLGEFRAGIGQRQLTSQRQKLAQIGALLLGRSGRIQSGKDLQQRKSFGLLNLLRDVRTAGARGGGSIRNLGPRNPQPFQISGITGERIGGSGGPIQGFGGVF